MARWATTLFLVLFVFAAAGDAQEPATRPFPGVTFRQYVSANPPLHYFVVTIDLTNPRINLKVSRGGADPNLKPPWETTLMPVSRMAGRDDLAVAVNGNFFASKDYQVIFGRKVPYFEGNWARTCGWAMADGALFSRTPLSSDWPSLVVDSRGHVAIGSFKRVPADARQVVSGLAQIITHGTDTAIADSSPNPEALPAPHTVAGIDRDAKTLFLLVADGRRNDYSVGMSPHQMAATLIALGASDAIMLDGGGSTTLVMRDPQGVPRVINRPSDGHDFLVDLSVERPVADALGVVIEDPGTRPAADSADFPQMNASANRSLKAAP